MDLQKATAEEIEKSFALYQEMIKIMTAVDHKAPQGACCGKNKKQNITKFINEREKYISRMKEVKNRKIKPLWNGIIFVSKIGKHFNSQTITDDESLNLIEKQVLTPVEKFFDLSQYENKTQKNEDISVNGQGESEKTQKIEVNSQTREDFSGLEIILEGVNENIDDDVAEEDPKVTEEFEKEYKAFIEKLSSSEPEENFVENFIKENIELGNGELAKLLNEKGYKTAAGKNFTALVVNNFKKNIYKQ